MRQIVLDTETTGLEYSQGHRIIEIGCVEIINRRLTGNRFHQYIQPDRKSDEGALNVHGITEEFLKDKPRFNEIVDEFVAFIKGAQLIIHNAPFDVGFINNEFGLLSKDVPPVSELSEIVDTLVLARKLHPGQKNNLDALCKRYTIDNSRRELHGALLDAEILADVYLMMTGGQSSLLLDEATTETRSDGYEIRRISTDRSALTIINADAEETALHNTVLQAIDKHSGGQCLWAQLDENISAN